MAGLKILSYGLSKAEKVFTNFDFEKIMDTSDEWITTRTGIKERRFISENQSNTSLAIGSAKEAIKNGKINIEDIKVVIVATFTPDRETPAVSNEVAKAIGIGEEAICFDLNAACSGFVYSCSVAYGLLEQYKNKYALIIGSEAISNVLDINDRTTGILFGDGAGAAIIKKEENLIFGAVSGFVSDDDDVLSISKENNKLQMAGQAVFRFATDKMATAINKILAENNLTLDDIDVIIPHQANKRIIDLAVKKLGCDYSKFFLNLDKYGNTSAASIPMALYEANIEKNKKVLCVGFGAGLSYGAVLLNT